MSDYEIPAEVLDEVVDISEEAITMTTAQIRHAVKLIAVAAHRAGREQELRAAAEDLGIGQPRWVSVDSLLERADRIARDYGKANT